MALVRCLNTSILRALSRGIGGRTRSLSVPVQSLQFDVSTGSRVSITTKSQAASALDRHPQNLRHEGAVCDDRMKKTKAGQNAGGIQDLAGNEEGSADGDRLRENQQLPPEQTYASPASFIAEYFARFPEFQYNPCEETYKQFHALRRKHEAAEEDGGLHWSADRVKSERELLRGALVQEFDLVYGTDKDSLPAWQELCRVARIDPVPVTVSACQESAYWAYVNLVDLVDTLRTGTPVERFPSEIALSEYTIKTGKYFPAEAAYGGFLKCLLRNIMNPRTEETRREELEAKSKKSTPEPELGAS